MEGLSCHLVRLMTSGRSYFGVGRCGNQEPSFEQVKCEIPLGHPRGDTEQSQLGMSLELSGEIWAEDGIINVRIMDSNQSHWTRWNPQRGSKIQKHIGGWVLEHSNFSTGKVLSSSTGDKKDQPVRQRRRKAEFVLAVKWRKGFKKGAMKQCKRVKWGQSKIQTSSYKISKSWRCHVQDGEYS